MALVSMMLKAESFSPYRCDRNLALGINLQSLTKVLRAAQNEDILTLKAEDAPDSLNLVFESSESDRLSEYDIKLMDIDQEHLGIPETEYAANISMPSNEFQKICRDLLLISESGEGDQSHGRTLAFSYDALTADRTVSTPQSRSRQQKKASSSHVPETLAAAR